jgi:hypothetical protein
VRSYYKYRRDKLILRRRFPYKFKTVEHYEQSDKTHNWKKMIQVDDHYRKIFYYHHRNSDGLIYREEQIGSKTFERFKNRQDMLIYRSVTYVQGDEQHEDAEGKTLEDSNLKKKLRVRKLAQKFELDHSKPAEDQIRKTVFKYIDEKENNSQGSTIVHYHLKQG